MRDHFWGEVQDIIHNNKDARETAVSWVYVGPFWGSNKPPDRRGMVDMLISDRFEIGFSKEMVYGVISGVKNQILATKTKMKGKWLFLGCMCGHFGVLMSPPTVGNGRYANPR